MGSLILVEDGITDTLDFTFSSMVPSPLPPMYQYKNGIRIIRILIRMAKSTNWSNTYNPQWHSVQPLCGLNLHLHEAQEMWASAKYRSTLMNGRSGAQEVQVSRTLRASSTTSQWQCESISIRGTQNYVRPPQTSTTFQHVLFGRSQVQPQS